MEGIKFLSLVVPAYKQEKTIRRDIVSLQKVLSKLQIRYEIIIVIDGMVDETYERVKKIKSKKIRVFLYRENKGKGYAVQYGMLRARGDVIGFIDAGMDINPTGVSMLLNHMIWYDADIIIGSKLHSVSRVFYPPVRKVFSWGYRTFTRMLFGFKVRDTQVGLKIFRRKVVFDVVPRLTVHNFAFDIEMLAVAYYLGYKKIYEAPVKLKLNPELSSVTNTNFWKIILFMIWDTLRVYYRLQIKNAYKKKPRIVINRKKKKKKKIVKKRVGTKVLSKKSRHIPVRRTVN